MSGQCNNLDKIDIAPETLWQLVEGGVSILQGEKLAKKCNQLLSATEEATMSTHDCVGELRAEIVEAQKTEAEYVKWKLIAVGTIASIAFGFTPGSDKAARSGVIDLLLCAVPLACAYIDFASINIILRIATIGAYLRNNNNEYELFVLKAVKDGINPFVFHTAALYGSSIVFNVILIWLSFVDIMAKWARHSYLLGGILGLGVGIFSWTLCQMKLHRLEELAEKHEPQQNL